MNAEPFEHPFLLDNPNPYYGERVTIPAAIPS
jgi:hypothetical protein